MPLQQTSGNVTQDAYGGGKAVVPVYVEQVFSTYCYTGNGGTQTITNGINMNFNSASNNWMMWTKNRSSTANHAITDSTYDFQTYYSSNNNSSYTVDLNYPSGLSTTGYTLGASSITNTNNQSYVSWVFGQQKYFFDVVSYSGNGTTKNIAHKLGSVPGCIIVKKAGTSNWQVYHQNLTSASYGIQLNLSNAQSLDTTLWNGTAPTSSVFTVGSSADTNASGSEYTAFIFGAGGTGGFGLTGTQDIISCGSFTTDSSGNATVNLGWEPQWILYKATTGSGNSWFIVDVMRGMSQTLTANLEPNLTNTENTASGLYVAPTATGITFNNAWLVSSSPYIYIAIRRGPMATPTTGTSVFAVQAGRGPSSGTASASNPSFTSNFPIDALVVGLTSSSSSYQQFNDRLRGQEYLITSSPNPETSSSFMIDSELGTYVAAGSYSPQCAWMFQRATGFFDVVCYTGAGSATTQNHNLGVIPQLMIFKSRSNTADWFVYCAYSNAGSGPEATTLRLDSSVAAANSTNWNSTPPTSTLVNLSGFLVGSGQTYVGYLFATVSGVSYVGSYTGTGGTQSIACGFGAGGARFILAKRTDSTGDWYCWDSAQGLTSSSSPYILWDVANNQTTGNNGTYASSGGFTLTSASPVNTSGGSFIFLAIA